MRAPASHVGERLGPQDVPRVHACHRRGDALSQQRDDHPRVPDVPPHGVEVQVDI